LNKLFNGYTIYKANGYWKGISEHSLIVEIIMETNDYICRCLNYEFDKLKDYICQIANQKEVLITIKDVEVI